MLFRTSPTWSLSHRIIYFSVDLKQSYRQVSSRVTRSPTAGRKPKFSRQFLVKVHQRLHAISANKIKVNKTFRGTDPWRFSLDLEDYTARVILPVGKVKSNTKGTDNMARSCDLIASFGTIKRPVITLSKLFVDNYD